jgi:putative ABC transport system permease protein
MKKYKKGGFLFLILIAYRNIYRNFRRSVLCMVAISVAVFVSILLSGFMEGMIDAIKGDIISFESAHLQINSKDYENKKIFNPIWYPIESGDNLTDMMKKISDIEGVAKVTPRIKTYATVQDNYVKNAVVWGIDIKDELKFQNQTRLAFFNQKTKNTNDCLVAGRLPENGQNECIIGYELAKKMKIGLNDKITLKVISNQMSDKFIKPKVVGIFDFNFYDIDKNYIIMPFDKLQKIVNLSDKTPTLFIYAKNINRTEEVKNSIRKIYNSEEIVINKWSNHYWIVAFDQMNIMMVILYIAFMVVASFLIINTIVMVISERMKEIGMMGALGMNRIEIILIFFIEAVILSLLGSLIGAFIGAVITFIGSLFPIDVRAFTGDSMSLSNAIFIKFSFFILLSGFAYGLIVSTICTVFPSLKAAFVEPVEALRR